MCEGTSGSTSGCELALQLHLEYHSMLYWITYREELAIGREHWFSSRISREGICAGVYKVSINIKHGMENKLRAYYLM